MADVLSTESAVEARLRDFLAVELRQAELDFPDVLRRAPSGDRPRLRIPAILLGVAVVIVALIALGPRLSTGGIGGTGAPHASAGASPVAPGSSAISALPSPSVVPSVTPTPTSSVATAVAIDCGRISAEACATAIDMVRVGHAAEVGAATRIVMDDTCPPTRRTSAGTLMTTICDRLYPFDAIVLFVTAGGDTTGWYSFSVVGLEYDTPTTVGPWVGDIPSHVLDKLREP